MKFHKSSEFQEEFKIQLISFIKIKILHFITNPLTFLSVSEFSEKRVQQLSD